jgi:hypothetical protein
MNTSMERLDQLSKLDDGWAGESSVSPTVESLAVARTIIETLQKSQFHTFPDMGTRKNGGIDMDWSKVRVHCRITHEKVKVKRYAIDYTVHRNTYELNSDIVSKDLLSTLELASDDMARFEHGFDINSVDKFFGIIKRDSREEYLNHRFHAMHKAIITDEQFSELCSREVYLAANLLELMRKYDQMFFENANVGITDNGGIEIVWANLSLFCTLTYHGKVEYYKIGHQEIKCSHKGDMSEVALRLIEMSKC